MEKLKATVEREDDKRFIKIWDEKCEIRIPLSDDDASKVKSAFNQILLRLKSGPIQLVFESEEEDLFSQAHTERHTHTHR